jgi:hypothetical protein
MSRDTKFAPRSVAWVSVLSDESGKSSEGTEGVNTCEVCGGSGPIKEV